MVSLKWGEVLSTLLPGALSVYALSFHVGPIQAWLESLAFGPGVALLMLSALTGGSLEALTRVSWEQWLVKKRPPPDGVLSALTPENLPLYERGVQSSYKYVTFYANFAWAVLVLDMSILLRGGVGVPVPLLLAGLSGLLLRASFVQWTYFVNYQEKVFQV